MWKTFTGFVILLCVCGVIFTVVWIIILIRMLVLCIVRASNKLETDMIDEEQHETHEEVNLDETTILKD